MIEYETFAKIHDCHDRQGLTIAQIGIGLLATLIRAGLAVATPGVAQAGGRTLGMVRIAITEMGGPRSGRDRGSVPAS